MGILSANPSNVAKRCRKLRAGDRLVLKEGIYKKPLVLTGIAGTADEPITIEAEKGAVFTSGLSLKKYTRRANLIAMRRQAAGYYPSIGQTADEAVLSFIHCRHIVLCALNFRRCWPTAVYLEECQHMTLDGLTIREGTIAIGANGSTTRDLLVVNCDWKQDVSADNNMWNSIPWTAIHGSRENSGGERVDPKNDYRAYDGDFFRAWDVAGNVVIRNNRISDAFNGIHFFNRLDQLAPGVDPSQLKFNGGRRASANILIENNIFTRIRDNAIEPEDYAWNWVIRHNIFADCYCPFSLELQRAGWFYIYGNYGWVNNQPGLDTPEPERTKCSHFKLGGSHQNEGAIHVFLNSWYYRKGKGIFPKGALKNLRHFNNAIGFGRPDNAGMFGKTDGLAEPSRPGSKPGGADDLNAHFTRQWDECAYDIVFDGDISEDSNFPDNFRKMGFPLGLASKAGPPGFAHPESEQTDLTVGPDAAAYASSIAMTIELPDGTSFEIPSGLNVGAYQATDAYCNIDEMFGFLPEAKSIPDTQAPSEKEEEVEQKQSLLLF
ncbi:right-handed parallel beta-helix repeat-containing protein [Hoeflea sp. TYP-13]|uniref:right-handed parallel beta-helix repeat-containing protein n=1 Tax=Hoeflea sp. TYP-13 TaxID=3230023 RepID=UPI0034C6B457